MADPHLPGRFTLDDHAVQQDTRWWGGEPLWITAERQGLISRRRCSGPAPTPRSRGAARATGGPTTTICRTRPAWTSCWTGCARRSRPGPRSSPCISATVDTAGHDYGPEAPEVAKAVAAVDAAIARLTAGIEAAGLAARTHVVLVSDHGMAALSADRVIVLDDYLDIGTVELLDSSPVAGISRRPGSTVDLYAALKDKHPALQVFTPDNLPAAHRPGRAPAAARRDRGRRRRVARDDAADARARARADPGGTHGYAPSHRSMHGLFVAAGPQFRRGIVVPRFESVHVYEMLCRLLGLQPASNDGDPCRHGRVLSLRRRLRAARAAPRASARCARPSARASAHRPGIGASATGSPMSGSTVSRNLAGCAVARRMRVAAAGAAADSPR